MKVLLLLSYAYLLVGTLLAIYRAKKKSTGSCKNRAVSILKPLKGLDKNLEENLESFFRLKWDQFELLFSVASANDPAISIVNDLMKKYPKVDARLFVGERIVGINPKVNNLVIPYETSKFDYVLISDSNVQVSSTYLEEMMPKMDDSVGLISAAVAGKNQSGFGGELEAIYLNSFYVRAVNEADCLGFPCVIGKSMAFKKELLKDVGGIAYFGKYIAEDHQIGAHIAKAGKKIVLMDQPVWQNIGELSLSDFWSRHIRWARIRRNLVPAVFFIEPLSSFFCAVAFGLMAFKGTGLSLYFLGAHILFWLGNDAILSYRLNNRISAAFPLYWIIREIIYLPMWISSALSNEIDWRGNKLLIKAGGLVEMQKRVVRNTAVYIRPKSKARKPVLASDTLLSEPMMPKGEDRLETTHL